MKLISLHGHPSLLSDFLRETLYFDDYELLNIVEMSVPLSSYLHKLRNEKQRIKHQH